MSDESPLTLLSQLRSATDRADTNGAEISTDANPGLSDVCERLHSHSRASGLSPSLLISVCQELGRVKDRRT